ncbi:branched-chain amino acid ABC transporter permease [Polaromonas sp. P1-6]|nr:branched-chain amino acid ABC transporter permease [Polaromonas sp. P1-6]
MEQFSNILTLGLLLGGIYALVSVGLNLIFGVIRIINFAQGEFVMLGMYGAYACYSLLGVDPYVALVLVVPILGLLGMVVYWLIMRPLQNEPMMQVFASFGLLLVLQNAVLGITGGLTYSVNTPLSNVTFALGAIQISLSRLVVLAAAAVVALALGVFLTRTTFGQAIRAVAQDRKGAQLMGINVERTYMWSFAIRDWPGRPGWRAADADLHDVTTDWRKFHHGGLCGSRAGWPRERSWCVHRWFPRGFYRGDWRVLRRSHSKKRHSFHGIYRGAFGEAIRASRSRGCRGGRPS